MSSPRDPAFSLMWKGRPSGPFSLAAIRERLKAGEISRMHQINVNGKWMILDEFLELQDGADPEAKKRAEAQKREAKLRQEFEQQLAAQREEQNLLEERLAEAEKRSPLSHLLPPPMPPPGVYRPPETVPPLPPLERPGNTSKNVWLFTGLGCGALLLLLVIIGIVFAVFASRGGAHSSSSSGQAHKTAGTRVEAIIMAAVQKGADENKQKIFDSIHPVGTARSVKVHDVTITAWKHGIDTNRFEDILQFTARYTVYWEGPIEKDGYTKLSQTYDAEAQRYAAPQILATNGITTQDAGDALGALFGAWLQGQMNP